MGGDILLEEDGTDLSPRQTVMLSGTYNYHSADVGVSDMLIVTLHGAGEGTSLSDAVFQRFNQDGTQTRLELSYDQLQVFLDAVDAWRRKHATWHPVKR
jgi:hypothetical protein